MKQVNFRDQTTKMKKSIYLETTVVSYYTSKPGRDIIVLAHQEITREWWHKSIKQFEIFISEVVIEEASMGDPEAAKRRLEELRDFPHLELNDKVEETAQMYMKNWKFRRKRFGMLRILLLHQYIILITL